MSAGRSFDLWGGRADVWVTRADSLDDAVPLTRSVLCRIDETCSPYRADSEITALNDNPAGARPVSRTLLDAIRVSLVAAAATDGLSDPTVGTVTLPITGPLTTATPLRRAATATTGRWAEVKVDPTDSTVTLPQGVRLDLGSTAKAWAADLAAAHVATSLGCGVMVNLCGDIATAGAAPADGWSVLVGDDHRWEATDLDGGPGARITLTSGALATSSITVRARTAAHAVVPTSHIVDPRTRVSVSGPYRTVSVAAATCVEANAASTAALVRGAQARAWLDHLRLPARLVGVDGVVETTGGWPS